MQQSLGVHSFTPTVLAFPPLPSYSPCPAFSSCDVQVSEGGFSRYHSNISMTLKQKQQHLSAGIVQIPTNMYMYDMLEMLWWPYHLYDLGVFSSAINALY